jgi:hypothetical protein
MEAIGNELTPVMDEFGTRRNSVRVWISVTRTTSSKSSTSPRGKPPGTVSYWEFFLRFSAEATTATTASGDCETDIERFMVYVDRGGTMQDVTFAELTDVGTLMRRSPPSVRPNGLLSCLLILMWRNS